MRKILFTIVLLFLIVAIVLPNFSYAFKREGLSDLKDTEIDLSKAKDYPNADPGLEPSATKGVFEKIGGIFLYGAIAVAVVWGAILGAKFITGTVDEKATIKDNLVPYFIGVIVAFGAYGIWTAIINILS